MRAYFVGLLATVAVMVPLIAVAAAPKQLLGKSVVVTWHESRVQRHVGEANFRNVHASHSISVYISTSGRVFSRMTFATGAGTAATEQVQGQRGESPHFRARVPSFSDRSMTLFQPYQHAGMRRLLINFGADFATCSARVGHAKEEGAATSFGWSPITKRMVEFQSVTASAETCSVRTGNVFGAE